MKPRSHVYEIRIEEPLADCQVEWFPNLAVACGDGGEESSEAYTVLTGFFPDQTALFGVLARIRDLNLTLVSVNRLPPG